MEKVKSLLNKMSSPMRPPAGLGDLRLTKSFVSKVVSLFITTQSAEDSRQRRSGMTALLDVKAFTLVELLVVVLIIGILSAVAIPMYQGAVDKSHWSTMLPASKAIKDAEEAFKMTNGEYSDTMEHLDVQMNNADLTFILNTPNNLADPNVIRVTNSKLDNVRLASYLDESPLFAGQLHCEAKNEGSTPNERAQRLCEKLLKGEELLTGGEYTSYLLEENIDSGTCGAAGRAWSNNFTTCFKTQKDLCTANGMNYNNSTNFCGCVGGYSGCSNTAFNEGATCKIPYYGNQSGGSGCSNNEFNPGSACISLASDMGCTASTFNGATCEGHNSRSCVGEFTKGSVCTAYAGHACSGTFSSGSVCKAASSTVKYACDNATFKEGSKCVASAVGMCGHNNSGNVTYDGGCCEGQYCPSDAPRC